MGFSSGRLRQTFNPRAEASERQRHGERMSRSGCPSPKRRHSDDLSGFWHFRSLRPPTEVPNARHWKQPKNSRKGLRVGHGKKAGKTAEAPEKQSKQLFFGCFGCFSAVLPWPTRSPFRLFFGCFQCRAFGTFVGGRRDCKAWSGRHADPVPLDRKLLHYIALFFRINYVSGKTDSVQFKRFCFFNRALFTYKNGRFASSFLVSNIGFYKPRKRQICLSKVPLRKPI